MPKKTNIKNNDMIRSSAVEYLTFIAASGEGGEENFELRYEDENIWLSQKMMAALYGVDVRTVSEHIAKILSDHELEEVATIRKFRIVQEEGSRNVSRDVNHYNLQMIIAVGFKVNNARAVAFRKWANHIVKEFTIKGWVMDDERLKNAPDGKIMKSDVVVAKNYLNKKELDYLARIVTMYLDYAELQAERNIPMTMEDWAERLDGFLEFNGDEILMGAGKISAEEAKLYAESQFEKYRIVQDRLYESDFDRFLAENGEENLDELDEAVKSKSKSYARGD